MFIASSADNRILRLLKILLGLCLLTPLFVSSNLLFPYTAPKAFAFRILIEIAAVLYFYLVLKYPVLRPKKTALNLVVLIFLLVSFLAALAGVDFYLSWWGNLERMLGVWGLLHFVLFFLMVATVWQTEKEWLSLLKISVATSSIVALLAIIQKFSSLGLLLPQAARVFSTIGNAAFLATYLIFNIFFAGYLLFETILSRKKILFAACPAPSLLWCGVYCLLLIVNCFALLFTGTRGAYLGLVAGIIFCLLLFSFFYSIKKLRKCFLAALISIFILGALFFALRHHSFIQNNGILGRLASISLKDITAQNRLILWQRSWQAWQEKPWLGWGPENYEVAANKYFDSRLAPYEAWFDRSHNFIFDYGVAGGWLGLASYLSLFGAVFWSLKKIAKENFHFSVIFGSLLVAYLVQNFFVFDTFVSFLMLFFVLAMINTVSLRGAPPRLSGAAQRSNPVESGNNSGLFRPPQMRGPRNDRGQADFGIYKKFILFLFIIFVIIFLYSLNLKPLLAVRLGSQILSWQPSENPEQLNSWLADALALKTFASDEIVYQAAINYLAKADTQLTQNENFYKVAVGELQKIIERSPLQLRNYIALAWLDLYFSDRHEERIDSAISLAQKARGLTANRKEAYFILVAAYSISGQKQKVQEVVAQATAIDAGLGQEVKKYWENFNK